MTPPSPEVILTGNQVAAWLGIRPRQVARLAIPVIDLGRKTKRYLARDVITWLERHRRGGNA